MKYERFEDLPVRTMAADLAAGMVRGTTQSVFRGKGDLANQVQQAVLSISSNVAEGFEGGSTNEPIARQIRGWANRLHNSKIKGQPHLTDHSRQACKQRKRGEAFEAKLNAMNQEREQRLNERQGK